MLLALMLIGGSVLGLRQLVRRHLQHPTAKLPRTRIDPGVDLNHAIGTLPCPGNPPPPAGTAYWTGPVSPTLTAWAVQNLHERPIGTIIEDVVEDRPVAARIEWHTLQAATGRQGCFKGLSMLRYLHPSEMSALTHAGGIDGIGPGSPTVFILLPKAL